jgi:hypothetical protein
MIKKCLVMLLFLLSSNQGCGDDGGDAPEYNISPETKAYSEALGKKVTGLTDTSYEEWLKRFTVGDNALSTEAQKQMANLQTSDYTPTSYEDFMKRLNPENSDLMSGVLGKYQGLLNEDYSTEDNSKTENDYLDTLTRKFEESRKKAFEPVQENLIAENLMGSGPGYGIMTDFGKETAQGVGDITKQWAYEGIARKQQQQQYQDALKRGDYSTMYNVALSEANRASTTALNATNLSETSGRYYDTLKRGDIEGAFNMGEQLKTGQLTAINAATGMQFTSIEMLQNYLNTLSSQDLAKFNGALQSYEANQSNDSSLGGLGSVLGMGAGALLALPTGGMSLMGGAALGGAIGGSAGSMFG